MEPSDRLDSWKDIATYLQRDVSTVQRWEKREGMPVYRHQHDRLGSVYAFRSELDAWRGLRKPHGSHQRQESHAGPAAQSADAFLPAPGSLVRSGAVMVLVAAALLAAQLPSIPGQPTRRAVRPHPAAEQHYVVGRYYLWRFSETHLARAIEHFERATRIDPSYAPAFAALSNAWWARGMFGPLGLKAVEGPARAAAHAAMARDRGLAAAYVAQADIKRVFDRDASGAEEMFVRALSLDADDIAAHHSYALLLMALGRFPEALQHIDRASALDSLAPAIQSNYGRILYRAGRYEEALWRLHRALELEPGLTSIYTRLGDTYEQLGQYELALDAFRRSNTPIRQYQARVARILAGTGRGHEARDLLQRLEKERGLASLDAAATYVALGDHDRALGLLHAMTARGAPGAIYFPVDPKFAALRGAPGWRELVRRTPFGVTGLH